VQSWQDLPHFPSLGSDRIGQGGGVGAATLQGRREGKERQVGSSLWSKSEKKRMREGRYG
jgi:hypothetical protein